MANNDQLLAEMAATLQAIRTCMETLPANLQLKKELSDTAQDWDKLITSYRRDMSECDYSRTGAVRVFVHTTNSTLGPVEYPYISTVQPIRDALKRVDTTTQLLDARFPATKAADPAMRADLSARLAAVPASNAHAQTLWANRSCEPGDPMSVASEHKI